MTTKSRINPWIVVWLCFATLAIVMSARQSVSIMTNEWVRTCRIKPETLKTLEGWLNQRRRQWEQHFDRLAAVLDEQSSKRKKP